VNSEALKVLGIDENTPNPEGGAIDRDATGQPTGILRELASKLAREQSKGDRFVVSLTPNKKRGLRLV